MKLKELLNKYDWKNFIEIALYTLCVICLVWIFASYVNVILHNNTDRIYWTFNFFKLLAR